jgi:hypothetical protein
MAEVSPPAEKALAEFAEKVKEGGDGPKTQAHEFAKAWVSKDKEKMQEAVDWESPPGVTGLPKPIGEVIKEAAKAGLTEADVEGTQPEKHKPEMLEGGPFVVWTTSKNKGTTRSACRHCRKEIKVFNGQWIHSKTTESSTKHTAQPVRRGDIITGDGVFVGGIPDEVLKQLGIEVEPGEEDEDEEQMALDQDTAIFDNPNEPTGPTVKIIDGRNEAKKAKPRVTLDPKGEHCTCSCADDCPLGRHGMENRCTKEELDEEGIKYAGWNMEPIDYSWEKGHGPHNLELHLSEPLIPEDTAGTKLAGDHPLEAALGKIRGIEFARIPFRHSLTIYFARTWNPTDVMPAILAAVSAYFNGRRLREKAPGKDPKEDSSVQELLLCALVDLVRVIEDDTLIPPSVSYMKQAKAAIAVAYDRERNPTIEDIEKEVDELESLANGIDQIPKSGPNDPVTPGELVNEMVRQAEMYEGTRYGGMLNNFAHNLKGCLPTTR